MDRLVTLSLVSVSITALSLFCSVFLIVGWVIRGFLLIPNPPKDRDGRREDSGRG